MRISPDSKTVIGMGVSVLLLPLLVRLMFSYGDDWLSVYTFWGGVALVALVSVWPETGAVPTRRSLRVLEKRPAALAPYREPSPSLEDAPHQHAALCRWCRWNPQMWADRAEKCVNPWHVGPTDKWASTLTFNASGQCQRYAPSLWTRLLQVLRIRPWIDRRAPKERHQ